MNTLKLAKDTITEILDYRAQYLKSAKTSDFQIMRDADLDNAVYIRFNGSDARYFIDESKTARKNAISIFNSMGGQY